LLAVVVHSAGIQDRVAARAVLMRLFCLFGTIQTVFVDGGYTGTLIDWAKQMFGYTVEVVKRTDQLYLRFYPSAGSSNAPLPGSTGHAASAKTTSCDTPRQNP
jgi:hypothetical protein